MNDKKERKFTCKSCGGHELTIAHVWNIQAGNDSESWREWGPLKDNHHWQYEFKERSRKMQTMKFREVTSASLRKMTLLLNRKNMKSTKQRPAGKAMSSL
jgi:hypothetical protein